MKIVNDEAITFREPLTEYQQDKYVYLGGQSHAVKVRSVGFNESWLQQKIDAAVLEMRRSFIAEMLAELAKLPDGTSLTPEKLRAAAAAAGKLGP